MIGETLVEIQETLENSAIARHSKSPLEEAMQAIQDKAVYYNEKTLRWHDSETKRFAPSQSGLDEAAGAIRIDKEKSALEKATEAPDDEMITKKKLGLGNLAGFLKEIASNTKEILAKTGQSINMTAEDEMETAAWQENRDRDVKKRGKTLTGIWDAMKENAKGGWLAKNWKLILAGLIILFAPLKWFKPLWEFVKGVWNFSKDHPIIASLLALGIYLAGPLNLIKFAVKGVGKLFGMFFKSKIWGSIASKVGTVAKGAWAATKGVAGKAVGAVSKIGMKGALGGAALLAGVALAIKDGIAGAKLSKEWGTSKAGGVAGAVLGGTDKGMSGAFKNAGKWALIGAGIGSFVPVIGTMIGGLVGAGVGAIAGFFGGAAIAGWIDSIASTIKGWWDSVIGFFKESLMQTWEGIKDIWENGLSWERVWNLVKANPLFRLGEIIAEGIGNLWKKFKAKFSWIPGFGPDEAEAETKNEPPKTDAEKLEASKQEQRDIIKKEEKRIESSKSGENEYFGREGKGQEESQEKIDEARKKITKLGVDDRTHRENKAELAAVKSGKMTKDEYIVSERGQADRKDIDTNETIGMNKEEQLELYEEYAGTRKAEDYAPTKPMGEAEDYEAKGAKLAKPMKGLFGTLKEKARELIKEKAAKNYVTKLDKKYAGATGSSKWIRKPILDKIGRQLRGPNREAILLALKGTELEKAVKKTAGGLKGPADLSGPKYDKFKTPSGGLDMSKAAGTVFSSRQNPDKQRETMTGIHNDKAQLGNQAPAPSIISSNSVETKVQSNPLAYLNASSSRGKEIVTSR
jgi:hypothetical protein